MIARALWFVAPRHVEVRPLELLPPAAGEGLVAVECSAVSAGSELLAYQGAVPADLPLDATLAALAGPAQYPFRYGYAATGRVVAVGAREDRAWLGRRVFAFQPHATHFVAPLASLLPVPPALAPEAAALYPSVETALTLVLDARPLAGERVVVVGQGVIGLLVIALLARFPLALLAAVDPRPERLRWSATLGAQWAGTPAESAHLQEQLGPAGADLVIEVSGQPAGLALAQTLLGFQSRLLVGSWYGTRPVSLDLGGRFHRDRVRIEASQVSTIAPALTGRWSRERRTAFTWELVPMLQPERLITHRLPLTAAPTLYQQLDQGDPTVLQALFVTAAGPDEEEA
ncbi:MAG: oxidoreductase [Dehalococcoidia bacterium]|nr:MAG: oxidoreductase [Dehalococcoidia bacterium]